MDARYLKKQNFGEIFENLAKLTGKVGLNSLAAGFVALVIPFLFGNYAMDVFFKSLSGFYAAMIPYVNDSTSLNLDLLFSILNPFINAVLLMTGYGLMQWLAVTFLHAYVSVNVRYVLQEERPDLFSVALKAIQRAFPVALLASILITLALTGIAVLFSVLAILFGGLTMAINLAVLSAILIVVFMIALFGAIIWFSVITTQSMPLIVMEDLSAPKSIGGSFRLMEGSFFRYLGIMIVISLSINIVMSMVLSPFTSVATAGMMGDLMTFSASGTGKFDATAMEALARVMQSLSESMWLFNGVGTIQIILTEIIMSVFFMVSYLDLKARKNPPVPEESVSGVQE